MTLVTFTFCGSNKKIRLKAKRNLPAISHTLIVYRRIIRVHEDFAREISVLWSQNLPLWLSASSVQPLQAHLANPQKKTRPQALASFAPIPASSVAAEKDAEKSCSAHGPYSSSLEPPFSSGRAPVRVPTSRLALAGRSAGPCAGRPVLPLQWTSLGPVLDGVEN